MNNAESETDLIGLDKDGKPFVNPELTIKLQYQAY